MVFNWLPTKSGCDTRSFYGGRACMNQDSCIVITKNAWSLWHSPYWGTSGTFQWTQPCKTGIAWEEEPSLGTWWFKLITPTWSEHQAGLCYWYLSNLPPGRIWHRVFLKWGLNLFVAASHQTGLDIRSKAPRPIKVGIKGRGKSGTSRNSNPASLCCS